MKIVKFFSVLSLFCAHIEGGQCTSASTIVQDAEEERHAYHLKLCSVPLGEDGTPQTISGAKFLDAPEDAPIAFLLHIYDRHEKRVATLLDDDGFYGVSAILAQLKIKNPHIKLRDSLSRDFWSSYEEPLRSCFLAYKADLAQWIESDEPKVQERKECYEKALDAYDELKKETKLQELRIARHFTHGYDLEMEDSLQVGTEEIKRIKELRVAFQKEERTYKHFENYRAQIQCIQGRIEAFLEKLKDSTARDFISLSDIVTVYERNSLRRYLVQIPCGDIALEAGPWVAFDTTCFLRDKNQLKPEAIRSFALRERSTEQESLSRFKAARAENKSAIDDALSTFKKVTEISAHILETIEAPSLSRGTRVSISKPDNFEEGQRLLGDMTLQPWDPANT